MSRLPQEGVTAGLAAEVLSTTQAARLCAVDRRTMLRWVEAGLFRSHRTGGGQRRILKRDLVRFMIDRGIPLPGELGSPPRIAIVDDEASVLRAIRRIVLRMRPDAEVRTASDGFTAGVLVAGFRPHLLFLDIVMPGMSGLEVCRRLRSDRDHDDTAIVIVSAHLGPELEQELLTAGANRCVHKPFGVEDIGRALDEFASPAATLGAT